MAAAKAVKVQRGRLQRRAELPETAMYLWLVQSRLRLRLFSKLSEFETALLEPTDSAICDEIFTKLLVPIEEQRRMDLSAGMGYPYEWWNEKLTELIATKFSDVARYRSALGLDRRDGSADDAKDKSSDEGNGEEGEEKDEAEEESEEDIDEDEVEAQLGELQEILSPLSGSNPFIGADGATLGFGDLDTELRILLVKVLCDLQLYSSPEIIDYLADLEVRVQRERRVHCFSKLERCLTPPPPSPLPLLPPARSYDCARRSRLPNFSTHTPPPHREQENDRRIQPFGIDSKGRTFFHFPHFWGDTRLYVLTPAKPTPKWDLACTDQHGVKKLVEELRVSRKRVDRDLVDNLSDLLESLQADAETREQKKALAVRSQRRAPPPGCRRGT
jgi:hypothetical protein